MHPNLVISYPHMGNYAVVFHQFCRHMFPDATVLTPPPITEKTVELGRKYSPDFVCSPFKYNVGNYIEALEGGANVLLQTGAGCRYGFYGELQEQILRDLGYDFNFVCLSRERYKPRVALKILREVGCECTLPEISQLLLVAGESLRMIDRHEYWMRENVGFEVKKGSCDKAWKKLLQSIKTADTLKQLFHADRQFRKEIAGIEMDKPENPLRVGIVGELYTVMEPFCTFNLERQLAEEGIVVSRSMSVWFLLFGSDSKSAVKGSGKYLKYHVGANGADSIAQSVSYAKRGYDGILHLKSFGCIPELNATPALQNFAKDNKIPVLQMSFDLQTSETGIQTRIEAFADMLRIRKDMKFE